MRFPRYVAPLLILLAAAAEAQTPADTGLATAQGLVNAGRLPQAEAAARNYLETHGNSAAAHYLLAFILLREDKPVPSLAEYTRAAQLQRPTAQQLQNVALDYVLAGDYGKADKWMTVATQWAPQDGEAWYSLGRIKYTENRFAEAILCFKNALALMPHSVRAENNLGLTYEGLDRDEDALAAYRQAIAWQQQQPTGPEAAQPYINLGTLLFNTNRAAEALPYLEKAAALAPDDARLCATLGKLYQRQDKMTQAQAQFAKAVALSPTTAAYHFLLGQAYRKNGKTAQAEAEFAQAAKLDGSHSSTP